MDIFTSISKRYRRSTALAVALLWPLAGAADTGVNDQTVQQAFQVSATIQQGCILGSGGTDVASYGVINFGQVASLPANVDAASATGAGSIVIQCTPGAAVTIALDNGLNASGSIAAGRNLKNTANTDTLSYQLYQDSGHNTVWGNGSNGGSTLSLTASSSAAQTLPVFARLFARTPTPSAGTYTDTVTVTVSY